MGSAGNAGGSPDEFKEKINSLRWIAYAPTNFNPEIADYPSESSLEEDLKVLSNAGFNGLITYGAQNSLADIPKIAGRLGFKGIIMGIWDIGSEDELDNAIKMSGYVDAYCVGNEGLYVRYELADLIKTIDYIKAATGKPATTTEQITDYAKQQILEAGDWIFPNIHPFLNNIKSIPRAVDWIKKHFRILSRHASILNKPLLFKEIGYPTRGDPLASSARQKEFFKLTEKTEVKFAYFEAFDQYWKQTLPIEPHWGLYDRYRKPKKFIAEKIKEAGQ